ncbi:MAG: hypothetical protein NC313_06840 [Butyrivibrio sp.]|nr:hypothetical protein [Butyrivibrio sp.]
MILFLVYDSKYLFFPYIERKDIAVKDMWKRGMQYCFLSKLCRKLKLPVELWGRFLLEDWIGNLKEYDRVIIFDAVYEPIIGSFLKRKGINAYIYMWDGKNRERLSQKQIYPVLSFNPKDTKNGMKFQTSFYCREILKNIQCTDMYDIFYCGRAKRRSEAIKKYYLFFKNCGLNVNFHIVTDSKEDWGYGIELYTDELSYYENLVEAGQAKAILNIVDCDEFGAITPRCLEALYLGKKLITNDTEICKSDLYNENNVYILGDNPAGEEEKRKIKNFLALEYVTPSQELLLKYDINYTVFGEDF